MDGEPCRQVGCEGAIDGGFCNRCGLEPAGAAPSMSVSSVGSRSAAASSPSGLSGRSAASASRRGSGATRGSSRKNIGMGLVAVPPLPTLDPARAVMAEPVVPDHKRFCANPDCHDAQGNPTPLNRRQAGCCPQCGRRYSFLPTLQPGDLVAEQYEVKGCLAFGGLGWVYLAKDTTLGRWVVLKGLLNTGDEAAAAAAVAERQFLAAVKHPNIVGIYNFVKRGTEGFIVMEYVGGTSVKDLRKQRGPLPPAEAVAYVHRILHAFAYLHGCGMVYCDFKPDNFMLEGDPPDVKLIDMGGVRLIDDPGGDIYGTRGYSAPEAGEGPTVASDLYTVGRTLAVLLMDFRYQSLLEYSLPSPAEQPVLGQNESLHRLLLRSTARDPNARFQSADEMMDQLGGVLRDLVAGSVPPRPVESNLFGGDVMALREDEDGLRPSAALLPELKVDPDDPSSHFVLTTAAVAQPLRRAEAYRRALLPQPEAAELRLRLAHSLIAAGQYREAETELATVAAKDPWDWRIHWYRAASWLAQEKAREALALFDRVYAELPGEPAVKLAVALAAELAGDLPTAVRLYDRVSLVDPGFTTACFGLARCLTAQGQRTAAVAAYARVPASSSLYGLAQMALTRALLRPEPNPPGAPELLQAAATVEALAAEGVANARLRVEVFDHALTLVGGNTVAPDAAARLLGQPLEETALRTGLERALRQLARLEPERDQQIALIDRANQVRPRTWV